MFVFVRWLDGKRLDDNAEGLWRVHDKLYDLTNFVARHPGGPEWLQLTEVKFNYWYLFKIDFLIE